MLLLKGPRGALFLMSEVPLYHIWKRKVALRSQVVAEGAAAVVISRSLSRSLARSASLPLPPSFSLTRLPPAPLVCRWSLNGRRLVTAEEKGRVRVWDVEQGEVSLRNLCDSQ